MFFKAGTIITYLDVHGNVRKLKCIENLDYVIKWRKATPYSGVARYECEDGHIIQLPNDAWALVTILKEEIYDRS